MKFCLHITEWVVGSYLLTMDVCESCGFKAKNSRGLTVAPNGRRALFSTILTPRPLHSGRYDYHFTAYVVYWYYICTQISLPLTIMCDEKSRPELRLESFRNKRSKLDWERLSVYRPSQPAHTCLHIFIIPPESDSIIKVIIGKSLSAPFGGYSYWLHSGGGA
jgi:hypothetical protein